MNSKDVLENLNGNISETYSDDYTKSKISINEYINKGSLIETEHFPSINVEDEMEFGV